MYVVIKIHGNDPKRKFYLLPPAIRCGVMDRVSYGSSIDAEQFTDLVSALKRALEVQNLYGSKFREMAGYSTIHKVIEIIPTYETTVAT